MKLCLVLKKVLATCCRRITVTVASTVNCFNEDSFTLQVEVYHTRLDISLKCTRHWDTRQYTLYTFCTCPIVLMDRSQMTQIRTWGGRRLMDQPSVRRDMMWAKNMPLPFIERNVKTTKVPLMWTVRWSCCEWTITKNARSNEKRRSCFGSSCEVKVWRNACLLQFALFLCQVPNTFWKFIFLQSISCRNK